MDDITIISEHAAATRLEGLLHAHSLKRTLTPAGILVEHPSGGSLSLSLWNPKQDLGNLIAWLRATGL